MKNTGKKFIICLLAFYMASQGAAVPFAQTAQGAAVPSAQAAQAEVRSAAETEETAVPSGIAEAEETEVSGGPEAAGEKDLPETGDAGNCTGETGFSGYLDVDYEASLIGGGQRSRRGAGAETESGQETGAEEQELLKAASQLPVSYSSEIRGYTTDIKDQQQSNLCWAFSYASAAETNMLRDRKASRESCCYSPVGISYFFYHIPEDPLHLVGEKTANTAVMKGKDYLSIGGSYLVTPFSMSGWIGPVNEEDIPFDPPYGGRTEDTYDFADYRPAAVQKGAYFYNASERDELKKAIMKYGALSAGIRCSDSFPVGGAGFGHLREYSGGKDYFVYHPDAGVRDHEVQIIGWDDTVPADLFATSLGQKPDSDGAWLVRNSWGEFWPAADAAHKGCCWLSYEDATVNRTMAALEMCDGREYFHNYHYDGNGSISSTALRGAAAVFRAQSAERITDVNIGFRSANVDYTVSVYVSAEKPETPVSGTLAARTSGVTSAEGFYTCALPSPVEVDEGSWFCVAVTTETEQNYYTEDSRSAFGEAQVRMTADVRPGEAYCTTDGSTWTDGAELFSGITPRVKAFTKTAGKRPDPEEDGDDTGEGAGSTVSGQAAFSPFWYEDDAGVWRVKDGNGTVIISAWLCDDAAAGGRNAWYLLGTDGAMLTAGLVQDSSGRFYSLETAHNGCYGMVRWKNGFYDCGGRRIRLEFSQEHDGSFGAVLNADGVEKLKEVYGVTRFDSGSCVYTGSFPAVSGPAEGGASGVNGDGE